MNNSIDQKIFKFQIKTFDPKEKRKRTATRKSKSVNSTTVDEDKKLNRATWADDKMVTHLLVAYRKYRPLGAPHGQVTKQWMAMTKAVNKQVPPGSVPFAKQTLINKLKEVMKQYDSNFSEYEAKKTSENNWFLSAFEREAYRTWKMYKEDIEPSTKESLERKLKELVADGDQQQRKRKLEKITDNNHDNNDDSEEIPDMYQSSDLVDPIDEDRKLLNQLVETRQRHHRELMAAIKENTEVIKSMHNDILKFMRKKIKQ